MKNYFKSVFLVVLGRPKAAIVPTKKRQATIMIGMLGATWTNKPNIFVPRMAPIRAMSRCVPAAVALWLVG